MAKNRLARLIVPVLRAQEEIIPQFRFRSDREFTHPEDKETSPPGRPRTRW